MTFLGTILAGGWSLSAVAFQFSRGSKVNVFGIIVAMFSALGLIGTIIFHNPTFYLESPILMDLVLGCIFFGSLLVGKPLIQIFAEI